MDYIQFALKINWVGGMAFDTKHVALFPWTDNEAELWITEDCGTVLPDLPPSQFRAQGIVHSCCNNCNLCLIVKKGRISFPRKSENVCVGFGIFFNVLCVWGVF